MPQVLPLSLGYTLWMFEYNIRAASVLGVVGAGGIGFQLKSYIDGFEYNKATTMMLVLLVVVTVIDGFSSQLRRRLESS
jgi:phosphonate transport system permease protein